jgi:hypothetical protein
MALLFCCASVQAATVTAEPAQARNKASLSLLEQTEGLPKDFLEHFFDLPLTVRIELDGKFLGDGRVVLSRNNTLQLLEFSEFHDSKLSVADRQRWSDYLNQPRLLGECASSCDNGLRAIHYSLDNSLLSLVTDAAESDPAEVRYHRLPEGGSHGLMLRNQLNVFGGSGTEGSGRYVVDAQGSVGNWTTVGSYQVDRSRADDAQTRQSIQSLYGQREHEKHFLKAGFFLPNFQGVARQPSTPGAVPNTIVGLMFGSSDSLTINASSPSIYPVYVTANRQGTVEIYRDGSLIYTQPVEPGLQLIDTRRLPGGIYEVEVRLVEDGKVTSIENELINKPLHWSNSQERWRYSSFIGQQRNLLNSYSVDEANDLAVGGVVNYLAHPRAVLGAMAQQIGEERAVGGSLNWHASDTSNLYTNVFHSSEHGVGLDVQAIRNYASGSVMFNHSLNWQNADKYSKLRAGTQQNSAFALNHRLDDVNSLTARVSYSNGVTNGVGLDLSFSRRAKLMGSDANWRTSVFDRPATASSGNQRNRGIDVTLSMAIGGAGRRYSVGAGSRAASTGGRDQYVNAGVYQELQGGLLTSVNGAVSSDRYGVGLNGGAAFDGDVMRGDLFAQRSSLEGGLAGGLNLESTVAIGGGKMVTAGNGVNSGAHTGMIVDVESDMPDVELIAQGTNGSSTTLKPGRNFVPVTAYKPGTLQLDFAGRDAPAASIHPAMTSYHLNKGGVAYRQVKVMQTLTVMGQLLDAAGKPLRGAHVRNHAGRSVAEADGFFTLEMSARQPVLEVAHPSIKGCTFHLDDKRYPREGDVVMVGKLKCDDLNAREPLLSASVEQQG